MLCSTFITTKDKLGTRNDNIGKFTKSKIPEQVIGYSMFLLKVENKDIPRFIGLLVMTLHKQRLENGVLNSYSTSYSITVL